jgi:hypothetical protein
LSCRAIPKAMFIASGEQLVRAQEEWLYHCAALGNFHF